MCVSPTKSGPCCGRGAPSLVPRPGCGLGTRLRLRLRSMVGGCVHALNALSWGKEFRSKRVKQHPVDIKALRKFVIYCLLCYILCRHHSSQKSC